LIHGLHEFFIVVLYKYSMRTIAYELKKMEWEPLLPVEKKLIGWSLGLSIVLLGILVWVNYIFPPAGQ
jgi:hypothetical protein